MNLSDAQVRATEHKDGPMIVIAGPGSGKTLTITKRILHLTKECRINPGNILVITFTKAAAKEMEERYIKLGGEGTVNFGTFHAVFFKILRYSFNYSVNDIIKEEDIYKTITRIVRKMNMDIEDEKEFVEDVRSEISQVKNECYDLRAYHSKNCPDSEFVQIFNMYSDFLKSKHMIDFDDMLILCRNLLSERPEVLKIWQDKYKYILVDEFQDINRIQYETVKMLALPENNLFIVGDDDQSIYGFRGSKPEIMLHFKDDFKSAEEILLTENYRSQRCIVDSAKCLISHNRKRFRKEFSAAREPLTKVDVKSFKNKDDQNRYIIDLVEKYRKEGVKPGEIAVLFRTNIQARKLMGDFINLNIPFQMKDVVPDLFSHWIAKDILAYMWLAQGELTKENFIRVMNRPKRYISRDFVIDDDIAFKSLKENADDKKWLVDNLSKMETDLNKLSKMPPFAAITYIRKGIGYDLYLAEYAEYRKMQPEDLYALLDELAETAKDKQTFAEWLSYMDAYREELAGNEKRKEIKNIDKIALSTVHSAKGLEYKIVFIPDVIDGVFPYKKAVSGDEIEEERRIFYVAMTRAKEELHVLSYKRLYEKEVKPSAFLMDMNFDLNSGEKCEICVKDFAQNDAQNGRKIMHKIFGMGTIIEKDGDRIKVKFDRDGKIVLLDERVCRKNGLISL